MLNLQPGLAKICLSNQDVDFDFDAAGSIAPGEDAHK